MAFDLGWKMNKCTYSIIKEISCNINWEYPVIDIGSMVYDSRYDLRNIFHTVKGIDFREGNGVDLVGNIHTISLHNEANTVICTSMLEHDSDPVITLQQIKRILTRNGKAIFTIPFNWFIHNYPSDYWRMTPDGLKIFLKKEFAHVQTFGIGRRLEPHTVVGVINAEINRDVIRKLNRDWPSENGKVYHYAKMILPPIFIHLIKWLMYRRFY